MSHTESKHPEHAPAVDREINARLITQSLLGLFIVVAIAMFLMLWMMRSMEEARRAGDPPPSPLAEANQPWDPPGPDLQEFPPTEDIGELEARHRETLESYGWVDEASGVVRIPIAEAMEVLADQGLPEPADVETLSHEIFGGAVPDESEDTEP